MTTPTGVISLSDVNLELSRASTDLISMNDTPVRTLAGIATGQISMDDLRGKTAVNYGSLTSNYSTRPEGGTFTFTISGGTAIPNGTYYWRVEYISNLSAADFVAVQGSFNITNNTGNFSVTTVNDTLDDDDGTFRVVVGDADGVPTVYVTGPVVTVTETTTYTATVSKTSIYRYGSVDEERYVSARLTMSQVPVGTEIFYKIVPVSGTITYAAASTTNSADLIGQDYGVRTSAGTLASSEVGVGISAIEYNNGTAASSKSFRVDFYRDVQYTLFVASTPTVTLRAAPTYAASFSPTSINEGSASTLTITATDFPATTQTLFYTGTNTGDIFTINTITGEPLDLTPSGSIVLQSSGVGTVYIGARYDGLTESAETVKFDLRTVSTSGTIVKTANLTVNDYSGVVSGLNLTRSGGGSPNVAVYIYLQITSIAAYKFDRVFTVEYNMNSLGWSQSGLTATTITVPANSTSSLNTLVYYKSTGNTQLVKTIVTRVSLTGHTTKSSDPINGPFYI